MLETVEQRAFLEVLTMSRVESDHFPRINGNRLTLLDLIRSISNRFGMIDTRVHLYIRNEFVFARVCFTDDFTKGACTSNIKLEYFLCFFLCKNLPTMTTDISTIVKTFLLFENRKRNKNAFPLLKNYISDSISRFTSVKSLLKKKTHLLLPPHEMFPDDFHFVVRTQTKRHTIIEVM